MDAILLACMQALHIPKRLLGYRYIFLAVSYIRSVPHPQRLSMMHDIYPHVADCVGSSRVMVDRAIRHAITVSWQSAVSDVLRSYLGYAGEDKKGMPTNAEYLYMLSERVRILCATSDDHALMTETVAMLRTRIAESVPIDEEGGIVVK